MKFTETKGCRFWAYEPASGELVHKPERDRRVSQARREAYKADCAKLKEAGEIAKAYGMNHETCVSKAGRIERKTGVEMHVFNHDYL